jgi:DNA-binding MarR family transcriptional regulator
VRRLRDATDRRRILVELTEQAQRGAAQVYGPLAESLSEYATYSDAELRLIIRYIERGSELLLQHASRIEELPRRPRDAADS